MLTTPDISMARVKRVLEGESLATMLFGSAARGDESEQSDIDVLQLTNFPRKSYKVENFNVSVYTPQFLSLAASKGSLFVLHLITDGIVIEDPATILADCLRIYAPPPSYGPFLRELRTATDLLNVTEGFYERTWQRCNQLALFILRSALFADAAAQGRPMFSISSIADWKKDERILAAYQIKYQARPESALYWKCTRLAQEYLGAKFTMDPDSARTIIAKSQGVSDLVVTVGMRMIDAEEWGY
jgi:Nucleotidyltransferase domain